MSDDLTSITGIGEVRARRLKKAGIVTFGDLSHVSIDGLRRAIPGAPAEQLERWREDAAQLAPQPRKNWATEGRFTVRYEHRGGRNARMRTIVEMEGSDDRREWSHYEFAGVADWLRKNVRSALAAKAADAPDHATAGPDFEVVLSDPGETPNLGPHHVWSGHAFSAIITTRPETLVGVPSNQISLALVDLESRVRRRVGWVERMSSEPTAVELGVRCTPVPHGVYRAFLDLGPDESRPGPLLMAV